MYPARLPQLALGFAIAMLFATPVSQAKKRIAIKTRATPEFVAFRESAPDQLLSYVFAEGEFFGHSDRGEKISATPLRYILETLAEDMAEQGFFPTTDTKQADMLIVVHWGAVQKLEDPSRMIALERTADAVKDKADYDIAIANLGADPTVSNPFNPWDEDRMVFENVQARADRTAETMNEARIARMIGFEEDLYRERQKPIVSTLEESLTYQLQKERYLVALIAWDNQSLKSEEGKKILWTAKLSMPALGTDFEDAVSLMSGAAAGLYGTEAPTLQTRTYKRSEYKIEMGEIEVVDSGDDLESE